MSAEEEIRQQQLFMKVYVSKDRTIVIDPSTSKDDLLDAAILMWQEIQDIKTRLRVDYRKIHDELFPKVA